MAFIPVSSPSSKAHSLLELPISQPRKQNQYHGNNINRHLLSSCEGLNYLRTSLPTTKHRVNRLSPCAVVVDWLDLSSATMDTTIPMVNLDRDVLTMIPSFVLNQEVQTIASFTEIPQTTFEPQVNTPALSSFLFISIIFSLLQIRINRVRDAAIRREEALKQLRQVKSLQLSTIPSTISSGVTTLSSSSSSSDTSLTNESIENKSSSIQSSSPSTDQVKVALEAYEEALKEEMDLRTILPGVRIVAPNDPERREEDIAAAKQFLGWDLTQDEDVEEEDTSRVNGIANEKESREELNKRLLLQSRRRFDDDSNKPVTTSDGKEEGLSNGAKAILLTVALSQILLLVVLSFDPMTANNVFTDISGPPPNGLPLSSWSK